MRALSLSFDLINRSHRSAEKEQIHCRFALVWRECKGTDFRGSKVLTVESRSETHFSINSMIEHHRIRTWSSVAWQPKNAPRRHNWMMQLRTPKRSVEIITTRVSASLCANNTRQIYKYREAKSAPLFAREDAIQHDVIVQATGLVSHR